MAGEEKLCPLLLDIGMHCWKRRYVTVPQKEVF
jgi:hypothetical protein